MITVKDALGRLVCEVKCWQFSRRLAKAEKRQLSIEIIVSLAEMNPKHGMTARLGRLNNNKPTHRDWTK